MIKINWTHFRELINLYFKDTNWKTSIFTSQSLMNICNNDSTVNIFHFILLFLFRHSIHSE